MQPIRGKAVQVLQTKADPQQRINERSDEQKKEGELEAMSFTLNRYQPN